MFQFGGLELCLGAKPPKNPPVATGLQTCLEFTVLYFYLNKSTNQRKHQGRFYRAFINYIDMKL